MSRRLTTIKTAFLTSVAGAALFAAAPAYADSLTPLTFSGTVGVGGMIDITDKVGTISMGGPTTARADVLFIMDTTGSMAGEIGTVQSAFAGTVTALSALGTVATGAAQFKDKTNDHYDPFDYQLTQDITTNSALTQTALSSFTASGGGDTPEQGLYALDQAATTTTWEAGAKKIAVIVGDAPAHDASHPTGAGTPQVTVSSVASALISNGVTMIALDAGSLNQYGQFSGSGSLLDDGVAGSYTPPPFSSDPTDLTNQIVSLIGELIRDLFQRVAWSGRGGPVGLLRVVADLHLRFLRPLDRPHVRLRRCRRHRNFGRNVLVHDRPVRRRGVVGDGVGFDPRHRQCGSGADDLGDDDAWVRRARLYGLSQAGEGHDVFSGLNPTRSTMRTAALGRLFCFQALGRPFRRDYGPRPA